MRPMADLKELYRQGQLEEILVATSGKSDPDSLFYRISALLGLNQGKDALNLLLSKRALLFDAKPMLTMRTNFDLRFALQQFDEAYEDLEYYKNQPYRGQEIEEALRALPKTIREQEKGASLHKSYTPEQIERMLSAPKNEYELLAALSFLGRSGAGEYLNEIEKICASNAHHDLKAFALEILIKEKDPRAIKFVHKGKAYDLLPAGLTSPFENPAFIETAKGIFASTKDPSKAEIARSLLDQVALSAFPEYVFEKGRLQNRVDALLALASSYLEGKRFEGAGDEASSLAALYQTILEENPPLEA